MATALKPRPASLGGPSPGPGYTWTGTRWVKKLPQPWAGLTPYTPFKPLTADQLPPGSYDVGLDAQLAAARRGLGYTEADYARDNTRSSDDLQRGLAQLLGDKTRATDVLNRSFGNLRVGQYQAARAAGVARGGALAQALEKRTANQAFEQAPIDESYNRGVGSLSLAFQRGLEDRGSALERARSETGFFAGDTAAAKIQQAKASGFEFPTAPAGENVSPGGTSYRIVKGNLGTTWYLLPDGRITKTKPR